MKVKFLQDYAGRETAMRPYQAGAVADIFHAAALDLIAAGIASEVKGHASAQLDAESEPEPPKKPTAPRKVKASDE